MPALLKVDYDRARLPGGLEQRIGHVARANGARVRWYALNRSSSGRGWHLRVSVTGKWAPLRVIAAQLALGSDYRRECYNVERVRGIARAPRARRAELRAGWNVLYTRKWTLTPGGTDDVGPE